MTVNYDLLVNVGKHSQKDKVNIESSSKDGFIEIVLIEHKFDSCAAKSLLESSDRSKWWSSVMDLLLSLGILALLCGFIYIKVLKAL